MAIDRCRKHVSAVREYRQSLSRAGARRNWRSYRMTKHPAPRSNREKDLSSLLQCAAHPRRQVARAGVGGGGGGVSFALHPAALVLRRRRLRQIDVARTVPAAVDPPAARSRSTARHRAVSKTELVRTGARCDRVSGSVCSLTPRMTAGDIVREPLSAWVATGTEKEAASGTVRQGACGRTRKISAAVFRRHARHL